jgi:predicted Zn finger-like uncharacterized protein
MIVTCGNCSKRYLVDPHALGAGGRRVRCAACSHIWMQAPPEDPAESIELPPLPEAPPIVRTTSERPRRTQLPAVQRPSSRGKLIRWGAIAAAVVIVVWALIAGRASVIGMWPPAARLYAMIGYAPAIPGFGLELRQVTPSRGVDNGVPTLTIDGQVVNVSTVTRDVPKLKVALRDANDHELQSWFISVTDQSLLPGASIAFHTGVAQPADGATGVIVSFAPAGS